MTFQGDYTAHFRAQLNRLKTENRYRHFVELERIVGRHPVALRHHNGAAQEVTVWCSNDYLGMGQHPDVIAAMRAAPALAAPATSPAPATPSSRSRTSWPPFTARNAP